VRPIDLELVEEVTDRRGQPRGMRFVSWRQRR
jgi:hypothetical protein